MSKKTNRTEPNISTLTREFEPVGSSHELQLLITDAMHHLVIEDGRVTLAELGFLHQVMISYCEDHVSVKIYFHPKLATNMMRGINNATKLVPRKELEIFKNYLYVGNLEDVITYDTIQMPRCYIEDDELGRPALRMKNSDKTDDMEVLVLNCNLPLAVAFACDLSVADPMFAVSYETVGATGKNVKGHLVLNVGAKQEFPVTVRVRFTDNTVCPDYNSYDPDAAVPYLISLAEKARDARNNQKKLARKVSNDAKKIRKEQTISSSAAYLKNR